MCGHAQKNTKTIMGLPQQSVHVFIKFVGMGEYHLFLELQIFLRQFLSLIKLGVDICTHLLHPFFCHGLGLLHYS